jgi:Domain of unknown function (DUF6046)
MSKKYTINIAERKAAAFGGRFFNNLTDNLLGIGYQLPEPYEEKKDESENITLEFGSNRYDLPLIVACDFQLTKSVKTTTINEAVDRNSGAVVGGGEVLESWGNKGWDLSIRGLIIDEQSHNRPFDLIRDFSNTVKENVIYTVQNSNLFNAIGISCIYVLNVSLPTLEGFKDTQPYVIAARSYVPAVLELRSN